MKGMKKFRTVVSEVSSFLVNSVGCLSLNLRYDSEKETFSHDSSVLLKTP